MKTVTILILTLFACSVFGQDAVSGAVVAADPAWLGAIKEWLAKDWAVAITGAGIMLELLMRALKTEKPKSLLYVGAAVLHVISSLLEKVAASLDKILQRVK